MSNKTKFIELIFGMFIPVSNICVSESVKKSFHSYPALYRQKLKVVYNGLPHMDNGNIFKLNFQGVIIGFIGRLDEQKNPVLLIKMAAELKDKINFTLVIAGDGPLRPMLETYALELGISDKIIFLGNISGNSINDFYSSIDIFVMPSLYEGFGRTVLENMMFGNPMILSDLDVLKEVALDTAFFVKNVHTVFSEKVLYILSIPPSDIKELKNKIRDRANQFTIEKMIDGYEFEIRKCL